MFNVANAFPNNLSSSREDPTPDPQAPLQFVNYYPVSANLQQQEHKESQIKEIEQAVESKIKFIIKSFLDQEQQPLNIIPKKGNLDLKKFLNKRLEKLNKRTEKAINKLLRKICNQHKQIEIIQQIIMKIIQIIVQNEQKGKKFNEANGIQEEDQEDSKAAAQNDKKEQEVKFNPMYNRNVTYDSEMYDEDEIAENEQIKGDGNRLIEGFATQEKIYQKLDESDSD
ncbi:hypothetical protein ABPG72_011374 [Tetrahymena utriculariae]